MVAALEVIYQPEYKCGLCGISFLLGKLLDRDAAYWSTFHRVSFSDDNSLPMEQHGCQDGSFGVAVFVGYRAVKG